MRQPAVRRSPANVVWAAVAVAAGVALAMLCVPAASAAPLVAGAVADGPAGGMTVVGAVILGLVEGVTEYLPVSSTGHLAVVQDLLGIGTASDREKEAADAYAVVIQSGAILAVAVLYWRRLLSLVRGLLGRDPDGRRVLIGAAAALAPFGSVALVVESRVKEHLFGVGPVIVAWVVGGIVLLALSSRGFFGGPEPEGADTKDRRRGRGGRPGAALETITAKQAFTIGVVQCLALWPGTSRSLVTIIAALAVGLSLAAAVEFSFLLGLATLGAATLVDGAKHGELIIDTFGLANPVIGFVVAFVSAVLAVRWMVTYLQRHSMAVFGWYRLGVAGVVGVLWWQNLV